jgi:hypothetical protein
MNAMESKLQTSEKEGTEIRGQLEQISTAKLQMEKKTQQLQQRNQKLQSELEVEKQMCVLLRKDKETLTLQKEALETLRRQVWSAAVLNI